MTLERAARLRQLFAEALEHAPDQRAAFLDAACADDPDLRRELDDLLQADQRAQHGDLVKAPALDLPVVLVQDDPLLGQAIGSYRLMRRLGQGGMGEVYLARREAPFKQQVAVKLIRQGLDTREALQRFDMERQILASLTHPHIARLLDGGLTEEGLSYLVMEYVEGEAITRYCDTRQLTVDERLQLFQQVCRAVHYAHQNLVVHRDLKPSNILVTRDGVAKLLDFGVAKLLNPVLTHVEAPVTRTMFRVMTPEYAAPEQVRGEAVTTATDVYALGVLLYELLTGHRPYHLRGTSPLELERVICLQEPERPSTRVGRSRTLGQEAEQEAMPVTPQAVGAVRGLTVEQLARRLRGDLDNIVLKALRKEAHLRYASAEQLGADLERYALGLPVEAQASTVRYRMMKFVRRHRAMVVAFSVVLLLLVAGIAGTAWQARVATAGWNQARLEASKATQVKEFLMGLFEASNPDEALGDTLTAHELLARGVERAEALVDEPEVQAEMLDVVGDVYVQMGAYVEAEPLLRRALALRRQTLGPKHPDVATSLMHLGHLFSEWGDYDMALPLLREALDIRLAHYGAMHSDVAWSTDALALLYNRNRDFDAAEPLHQEALAIRRTLYGENHPEVATSLNNLGFLRHRMGDLDTAERYYREALAIRRRVLEPLHPDLSISVNNLGVVLRQKGDLEAAEPLYYESLEMRREIYGEDHPRVATALNNLGTLLKNKGNLDAAEHFYRQTLALDRKLYGEDHSNVAFDLINLGGLYRIRGDLERADSLYREALAMQRRVAPNPRHSNIARALRPLALVLQDQGEFAAAAAFLHEALSIVRETYGADHQRTQSVSEELADLYDAWEKPEQAAHYRSQLHND